MRRRSGSRPFASRAAGAVASLGALASLAACGPLAPGGGGAARTRRYTIVTSGRAVGDAELSVSADGTRTTHMRFGDRGRGPESFAAVALDARGAPIYLRATGHQYEGAPVDERLDLAGGELRWRSTREHGAAPAGAGFYLAGDGPFDGNAMLARALLAAPEHRLALLPAGAAWIEDTTTLDVTAAGHTHHARRVAIGGLDYTPVLVWLDDDGEELAEVSAWTSLVPDGEDALIAPLLASNRAWMAARSATLARTLAHAPPAAGLAITHARVFDAAARTTRADQTVIVVGDRITAVGDAAATPPPAGAEVVDARGRTLVPGLWDMHVHLFDDGGLLELGSGVTTVRDLGNDLDDLGARVARFDAGTEVGPRVLRAGLIDGPGPLAAPAGLQAATPDEARAAVERYAALGYVQIKIYSSVAPELVPVIAEAAHAHHLRVSGHVPFGMNAAQAVEAGFDELQHVNFLFLQFLAGPKDDTRTPLRYQRVAERGAALDLDGAEVGAFLDELVAHHTVIDPTLVTFEGLFDDDPGALPAELAPFAGRLPATVERGARAGGLPARTAAERATFRASHAAMMKMVATAWRRGIQVVAGTDEGTLALPRELELYVAAGIPAADVLALDTLGAARVMGVDARTGSIEVGKDADLLLVDGDPTADISNVRKADAVICRGKVYDPAQVLGAVGIRPRAR